MLQWLRRWWRDEPLSHLRVVMLTRKGCHLCEKAWAMLREAQSRFGFRLSETDIDSQPELLDQYGDKVPVVLIDGRARFWGCVCKVLLHRHFRAELRRVRSGSADRSGLAE